jgi:Mn2+/Fe2+ NRAMP family transporter
MKRRETWLDFMRKRIGPGVITGASDDDPSGILVYLQSGIVLGTQALWTALLTLPLMFSIQEMCARIGIVTRKGLIRLIKERYSMAILYPMAGIAVAVIIVNIGADLLAMGAVLERLTTWSRLFWIPALALVILYCTIFFSYRRFAQALTWLAFSLFFYVATAIYIGFDLESAVLATIFPRFEFTTQSIMLLAAILGTTISPYLFFWQAAEEMEEKELRSEGLKRIIVTKHELRFMEQDTFFGMLFSNATMWFIMISAHQLAVSQGLSFIGSFDEAALVLRPLLGESAFFAFGLGIIGTGLLAIPVLAGSVGYIFSEIFEIQEGIQRPFREAKGFYGAIIAATLAGMALVSLGFDPIKLLIATGVFYTLITPPLIYFIIRFANDDKLMKGKTNGRLSNILGWSTFAVMTSVAAILLWSWSL